MNKYLSQGQAFIWYVKVDASSNICDMWLIIHIVDTIQIMHVCVNSPWLK